MTRPSLRKFAICSTATWSREWNKVGDELKSALFKLQARIDGNDTTIKTLFKMYENETADDQREVLMVAMCTTRGENIIHEVLEFAWKKMKIQDVLSALTFCNTRMQHSNWSSHSVAIRSRLWASSNNDGWTMRRSLSSQSG